MKNLAIAMSMVILALSMGACTKGCKKPEPKTPPIEEKALEHKNEHEQEKPAADANKVEGNNDNKDKDQMMTELNLKPGEKLFAIFDTSEGQIKAELFWEKAPNTVWNFAALAMGKKEWTNPNTGTKESKPLYNGTIFHRVIKGFMIQGGDPTGTGMGGPGYKFKDEFNPELRHNQKGILSMANAGPNTNGSQFFITEGATPHLDNKHSVFGLVEASSLEVVGKIASAPTGAADKPQKNIVINEIKIVKG